MAAALRSHGALRRLGLQGNELREPDDGVFLLWLLGIFLASRFWGFSGFKFRVCKPLSPTGFRGLWVSALRLQPEFAIVR